MPTPGATQPGPPTGTPTYTPLDLVTQAPSITPYYAKRTDLAPELQLADKSEVVVFRCMGTIEIFLVRPTDDRAVNVRALALGPGDLILHWYPPSLVGHYVPAPTPAPTETVGTPPTPVPITPPPTPTPWIYPAATLPRTPTLTAGYP